MFSPRINIGFVAGAAMVLVAASPLNKQLTLQPNAKIWVAGTSSVKSFRCEAKAIDAKLLSATPETAGADVAKLVGSADIGVDVAKLECGNGTMNEHMQKALKMKEHPTIAFRMSGYQVTGGDIVVKGSLRIAGQERPVELRGTVSEEGDLIRTTATAQINMTQWGVKPPSLMMGTMKVKETATIGYDIAVKR